MYVTDIGKMISELSDALYKETDAAVRIGKLLEATVEFFDADRTYVIEGEMDPLCAENAYERCAEGKEHQLDALKDFPPEASQYWLKMYKKSEIVTIKDMEDIREERSAEYEFFKASDVKSIILAPFDKGDNHGFVGVDNPSNYVEQPRAMAVIAYIIGLDMDEIFYIASVS